MLLFWPYIPGNIYCGGSSSRVHHLNGQLVVHGLTRAQVAYHRRSMETEAKANCRRFILGGKIECRTRNVWLECVALCT